MIEYPPYKCKLCGLGDVENIFDNNNRNTDKLFLFSVFYSVVAGNEYQDGDGGVGFDDWWNENVAFGDNKP